ncbi:CsbD family protein [Paraburkholderia sp. BCC1885]|uniref:CsbD family protein n=1 Tax=Paraburkholderia sp. BCC1885 TaxID=2562669 RepID=UPI001182E28A|nr:CsbD family protein [Paraburkholderia sp. BCC1885]
MNEDQIKGVALKAKGKLNEAVGKATGNRSQELKGDLQQAAGGIRQSFGKARARIRKTLG